MPVIPTIVSQERVSVGGIDVYADPNAAGAQVGRALQQLGGAVGDLGQTVGYLGRKQEQELKEKKELDDRLAVANGVAQSNLGLPAMEAQQSAPADGSGLGEQTFLKQKEYVDTRADELFPDNNDRRQAYKLEMYSKLPGWRDRATAQEFKQGETYNVEQSNQSITSLVNKVRVDPLQYDQSIKDADAVINAGKYTEAAKSAMRTQLRSDMAGARFESYMGEAKNDNDFVRLEKELQDPFWQKQMSQQEFDRISGALKTSRNSFLSGQDTAAKAMLDSMETRSKAREIIPDEEIKELSALTRNMTSAAVNSRYGRLLAQQDLLRTYGKASPSQIDQVSKGQREAPEVTGTVGRWASDASRVTNGEIPASYLINKLGIEYSAQDIKNGKFNEGNKAGTSSARGLFQFIDSTWVSMMQKYGGRFGYDVSRMSPQQMLGLRGDPALSTNMAALYALENKRALQRAGVTQPNDTELYLAHFLGPAGAIDFLRARSADPTGAVRPYGNFTAGAIQANIPVFKKGTGRGVPKSFDEVYQTLAAKMSPGVSAAKFDNIQYLESMRDTKMQAVKNGGMITQYIADGRMGEYELDSYDAMQTRGRDAAAAAGFYDIPIEDATPLTQQEAADMKQGISSGDADTQLQMLERLAGLDAGAPGMFKAALAQIGEKDTVIGYAASLAYDKSEQAVASDIVRGAKIIKEDKSIAGSFGTDGEVNSAFYDAVGTSLNGMSPATRGAIFEAAKAYYAQTQAARGTLTFDKPAFQAGVNKVLGSTQGEVVGEVNGAKIILPTGVTADTFDTALINMTENDFAAMSVGQVPPKYRNGTPALAQDISDEGVFEFVGTINNANAYRVRMADGAYLTTGETDVMVPYRPRAYLFVARRADLERLAAVAPDDMSPSAETPEYGLQQPADEMSSGVLDSIGVAQ